MRSFCEVCWYDNQGKPEERLFKTGFDDCRSQKSQEKIMNMEDGNWSLRLDKLGGDSKSSLRSLEASRKRRQSRD